MCALIVGAIPQVKNVEPEEIQDSANTCLHYEHDTSAWNAAKAEHHTHSKCAPVQYYLLVYEGKDVQKSTNYVEGQHFDKGPDTSVQARAKRGVRVVCGMAVFWVGVRVGVLEVGVRMLRMRHHVHVKTARARTCGGSVYIQALPTVGQVCVAASMYGTKWRQSARKCRAWGSAILLAAIFSRCMLSTQIALGGAWCIKSVAAVFLGIGSS